MVGHRLKTLEMNGYITVGSLTDQSIEHVVRYCPSLEQLSLNLLSFTSTLDALLELFSTPKRALQLRAVSLSSFRNVSRISSEKESFRLFFFHLFRLTNEFSGL